MANSVSNLDELQVGQANKELTANALFEAGSPATLYGNRIATTGGLVWGYYGGMLKTSTGYAPISNGTVALTDNSTNYFEADISDGSVYVNTTGFTVGRLSLYSIVTASGQPTSWTDYRQALLTQNSGGAANFVDLGDAPHSYTGQAGKSVRVNSGETGLEFDTPVTKFTELSDVPNAYTGAGGQAVRVNAGATALEFFTLPSPGATAFTGLSDVPNSYTGAGGQAVRVNAGATALEFFTLPSPGASDFTELGDVPNSYTGQGGKYVRVNAGATALEFTTPPSGVTEFIQLSDVPNSYTGAGGQSVRVNAGATALEFFTLPSPGATAFTGLSDVPNSYTGQGGKSVRVNAGATALEFFTLPSPGATAFTGLSDVPNSYTGAGGQAVRVNAGATALEFFTLPSPGATAFTGLSDVPNSYTGAGGQAVRVNAGATGLEFYTPPSSSFVDTISFTFDAGTGTLSSGATAVLEIPYSCTIEQVTILASGVGSLTADIQTSTYANYPTMSSIVASDPPTLSSAQKSRDTTLIGWTTAVSADTIMKIILTSASGISNAKISLKVQR